MKLKKLIPIIGICLFLAVGAVLATISTEVTRIQYAGNDSTTVFPYTFKVFANTELQVIVRDSSGNETIQALTTHYSVSGVEADAGGNVTMVTPPATGETLTILRDMPLKQLTDYTPGGRFPAKSHENALDKIVMRLQQLEERLDRSPHIKKSATLTDIEISDVTAGEYLRWNLAGDGIDSIAQVDDLGTFLQSGTGAVSRTAASKMGEIFSVKDFGAVGDGIVDDTTALTNAFAAGIGKDIFMPPGTYLCSTALTFPGSETKLIGIRGKSILLFTGATDGLVFPDSSPQLRDFTVEGLEIQTSNASGDKAIKADFSTNGCVLGILKDIRVTVSGSGKWAYGFYSNAFQSSEIYSLMIDSAATVAVHLRNGSNALRFYGLEISGQGAPAGYSERGIEIISGINDSWFFGGTIQAAFSKSTIYIDASVGGYTNAASPRFYGFHIENTIPAPTDGGDIVIIQSQNSLFHGFQGGSFHTPDGGVVRHAVISDSEVGNITWGSTTVACEVTNTRMGTYTDGGARNNRRGCSSAAGARLPDIESYYFYEYLAEDDATPTVATGGNRFMTKSTNPTTITNFDDGKAGQQITVYVRDADTTIDFGTNLKGNGGADWKPSSGDHFTAFFDGSNWYCEIFENSSNIRTLANDATPSILGTNTWLTGGTTTITDFDDGVTGQVITVIAEHSLDITDGTNIFLDGSANWSMTATDTLTLIQKADTKWYELSRSDSGA